MTYTDQFLGFLESVPNSVAYLFLGLSAFVENVFPPIPGDTITAFGAFLVGIGHLSFLGVYVSTTLGSLLGFLTLFRIGAWLGRRFFIEKDYRFFSASSILKAEQWFERFGYLLIAVNRFIPGVRSAVAVAGGICRLRTIWVGGLALVSAALWNLVWIIAGFALGSNWAAVKEGVSTLLVKFQLGVAVVIVLIVAAFAWRRILIRRRQGGKKQ